MRKIETNELKIIQLDLLLAFHDFCSEHQIKYSLAAGTLIGAVRHKGFIPWDDDIDVYLLREDYNRLLNLCPPIIQKHCILLSHERDSKWHRAYAKFYDNRTLMIEATKDCYKGIGVGIDVFPIDDVPDNQQDWESYNLRRRLLRDVYTIKNLKFSKKRSILKSLFVFICQFVLLPLPFSKLTEFIDKYSQKNNGKGYSHVYETCYGAYNSKTAWLKKDLDRVIDTEFEGSQVKIMEGYDDYLKVVYGDYMQLPPEEKRITHHDFEAWWKS